MAHLESSLIDVGSRESGCPHPAALRCGRSASLRTLSSPDPGGRMAGLAPLDRLRTGSVAAQILLLQLVVVTVVVIGGLGLAYVDARRDDQCTPPETRRWSWSRRPRRLTDSRAGASSGDPTAASAAVRGAGPAVDTGTELRGGDEHRRDPLDPSRPEPDRRPLPGHHRGRARRSHVDEEYTGTLGPSVRVGRPGAGRDRVVALVSVGITTASVAAVDLAESAADPAGCCRCAPGWVRVGAIGDQSPAPPPDQRARRDPAGLRCWSTTTPCCTPSARACCCSTRSGRVQLANDEARRLLDSLRRRGRQPVDDARPADAARRALRQRGRDPGRDPAGARQDPGGEQDGGDAGRAGWSGRSSRCATAPICRPSPASWTRRAVWPTRCGPRTTRRPTGCRRWCR